MHESSERLTCRRVREGLTEYLDDALPPSRRQGMDDHLAACSPCARLLAEMRATLERLASLSGEPMPPAMKRALLEAFRRTPPDPSL